MILVGFGSQVGRKNGAKIDPKRHRKNDAKKKGIEIGKKSIQDAPDHSAPSKLGSGKVPPFKAGQPLTPDGKFPLASFGL